MEVSTEQVSKRERTREMILEQALGLFREQGFEKTTMRAIADACGLSLGAAYYHFDTKDALVLEFYRRGANEARVENVAIVARSRDFKTRLRALLAFRLVQLGPYRHLVGVLARQGADMASPLSPFSAATKPIRDEAIVLIEDTMEGSNLAVAQALRPHLAKLLWLMQLGVILYWANDRSAGQRRTEELLDRAFDVLMPLLRATTFPLMGPIVRAAVRLIRVAESCLEIKEL